MSAIALLNEDEGLSYIISLMMGKLLVPFFGSGMTAGAQAVKYAVPNGDDSILIMRDLILKNRPTLKDTLKDSDFNKTADYFYKCVSKNDRKLFFKEYFTGVRITDSRKDILNLDWPYGYTLNVDDGIENSSSFKAVFPYAKIDRPDQDNGLLYKIHGDAYNEFLYEKNENIVFSYKQYIKALRDEENSDFLRFIKSDYIEKNIIFIGCSLRDEPDLALLYDEISTKATSNKRILIRTSEPSESEELALQDYGVNLIVKIDDYRIFFEKWVKNYKHKLSKEKANCYKYKNPLIVTLTDKKDAISMFCENTKFDSENNQFCVSDLIIERSAFIEIAQKIDTNSCFLVLGRRLSGKTSLITNICKSIKGFSHVLFPSSETCDAKTLVSIFDGTENTIFLIDSNSLTQSAYKVLSISIDKIKENNNKVIIFSNSNDNFIIDALEAEIIQLENKFDDEEIEAFNKKANRYGLSRRNKASTNLDYLNFIHENQRIETKIDIAIKKKLSFDEKIIFIILCAKDKAYYSDLIAFDIYPDDIDLVEKEFTPFIEIEKVKTDEVSLHSTHKIVHNSKRILINKLRELDSDDIRYCIEHIVKKLHKDRSRFRLYIEIILFDTLNQIFGRDKGAGRLIYSVYERLEYILTDDLHYWLQRAKSIYRLFPHDYGMLRDAYQYAKKVYVDSYDGKELHLKGALSSALISSLIYNIEKDKSEKKLLQKEIINLSNEVVFSYHFKKSKSRLKHELGGRINRRSSYELITSVCNDYLREEHYGELRGAASAIVSELKKSS